jgi:hypothetical protein
MSEHARPYDFGEAKAAISRAATQQLTAEENIRRAAVTLGAAERAYRQALAEEILRLKAEGVAMTVAQDLAKGSKRVADLRFKRDVAEGVKEAASSAIWRHTADRRELEQLVAWSLRVSPDGQTQEPAPLRSAA